MSTHASFDYRIEGDVAIVGARGDIDLTNVKRLSALLDRAVSALDGGIVLSLEGVSYFDSSTIHQIIACCKRLDALHRELVIVRPSLPTAARIFALLCLEGALRTFASVREAIDAVAFCGREGGGTMATAHPSEENRRWQISQESASRWSPPTDSRNKN